MDYELGGWLWLVMYGLPIALLAAAIAYTLTGTRRHSQGDTPIHHYLLDEERHAVLARARAPRR
jgi:hypothetical protein